MNNNLDEALHSYFSGRCEPPNEIKALLNAKLLAANQRRDIRLCCAIMLFAVVFSAIIMLALWVFAGNGVIILTCGAYLTFSLFGGVVIILACQINKETNIRNKYGEEKKCYFL